MIGMIKLTDAQWERIRHHFPEKALMLFSWAWFRALAGAGRSRRA